MTAKRHAISILVMLSAAKHPVIFHNQDFTGSFTLKGFRMTVMQTITGSFRFQRQDDKVEDDERQDDKVEDDEHQDDSQMHIVN